jgi:hypothetical protein
MKKGRCTAGWCSTPRMQTLGTAYDNLLHSKPVVGADCTDHGPRCAGKHGRCRALCLSFLFPVQHSHAARPCSHANPRHLRCSVHPTLPKESQQPQTCVLHACQLTEQTWLATPAQRTLQQTMDQNSRKTHPGGPGAGPRETIRRPTAQTGAASSMNSSLASLAH